LALYSALLDHVRELEGTAAALNLASRRGAQAPSAALAAALLSNDAGPDLKPKDIVPSAPVADVDTVLSQLLLHRTAGAPAAFVALAHASASRLVWQAQALPPALLNPEFTVDPDAGRILGPSLPAGP